MCQATARVVAYRCAAEHHHDPTRPPPVVEGLHDGDGLLGGAAVRLGWQGGEFTPRAFWREVDLYVLARARDFSKA